MSACATNGAEFGGRSLDVNFDDRVEWKANVSLPRMYGDEGGPCHQEGQPISLLRPVWSSGLHSGTCRDREIQPPARTHQRRSSPRTAQRDGAKVPPHMSRVRTAVLGRAAAGRDERIRRKLKRL